ncbi:MAG: M48 family metalloprotease, partial [bacterium]|nr:M48 family metalloprotease [bacterium]
SNPFGFIILLDEIFYSDLTPEEKTAVIAHELGHLTNENLLMMYNPDTPILFQIEADTYATKYARPEAVIGFLNKVLKQKGYQSSEVPSREYQFRIKNLEKIKQYRQAH